MISDRQVWEALPRDGWLHDYVAWASRWTAAPAAFHMVGGLTLLAQTVPPELAFPWAPPLATNLFGLLIGPSGVGGKGRAISMVRDVLDRALPASRLRQPGSPQACCEALQETPQVLLYPEFGSFLDRTRAGQLAPLRTTLTSLYDGDVVENELVDRPRNRERRRPMATRPRLSLLGGGTPSFLEAFTGLTDWEGGFMSRFLVMAARSRGTPPLAFEGGAERDRLVRELVRLVRDDGDLFSPPPTTSPGVCMGWSEEAGRIWEEWLTDRQEQLVRVPPLVAGAIERGAAHAAKVAMLLAWSRGDAREGSAFAVDCSLLEHSLRVVKLHDASVKEIGEGISLDRDAQNERRMRQVIERGLISRKQALRDSGLSARRGSETIQGLLEKGIIEMVHDVDGSLAVRMAGSGLAPVDPITDGESLFSGAIFH